VVAFIHGLDFPMPKVFALLEATGHALDHGVVAVQAVVARSLCCDISSLGSFSTGERKKNITKQQ